MKCEKCGESVSKNWGLKLCPKCAREKKTPSPTTQVAEIDRLIEKRINTAMFKTKSKDEVVQIAWVADGITLWHQSSGKMGNSPEDARRYIISSITRLLASRADDLLSQLRKEAMSYPVKAEYKYTTEDGVHQLVALSEEAVPLSVIEQILGGGE